MSESPRDLRFAIIGAGMAGMLSAIKLQEAGLTDFTIYEKADRFGGTWRENTYPGLACDVPSHLYSYSFAPNPEWSYRFSPGDEIRDYFEKVAADHGLDAHARFGEGVVRCEYADGMWRIETTQGRTDEVDIVIAATGVLHHPRLPDIEGVDTFGGACFHSARWDHSVPIEGKRVGVIGSGSTGVQIVSAIVDEVAHLSLFQRTAQWIMPQENPAVLRGAEGGLPRRLDAARGDARAPRRDVRHVRPRGRRQALAADQDDRGDVPRRTSMRACAIPSCANGSDRTTAPRANASSSHRRSTTRSSSRTRSSSPKGSNASNPRRADARWRAPRARRARARDGLPSERLHAPDDRHRA